MHKKVVFYIMKFVRDLGKFGWEMEDRKWVSLEDGLKLLAFPDEREILRKASKELSAPTGI